MKDYLDDFICDTTCEEYYGDDDDLYWGDQEEQAHAGEIMTMGSAFSTNEYPERDYKMDISSLFSMGTDKDSLFEMTLSIPSIWEQNANFAQETYGAFVDWEERFYICPECGEPVYECDWNMNELREFLCPICEFQEEE